MLICVWPFVTPWTVACQAPLSRVFCRQELEWVAFSFSRGSSQPRDQTHASCVSCTGRQVHCHCTTWEATKGSLAEGHSGYHIYWLRHVSKCSWGSKWSLPSAATTFTWSLFPHFGKLPRQVQSCSRTVGGPHALLLFSPRVISLAGSGRPGRRVTPDVAWERETSGRAQDHQLPYGTL